MLVKASSDITRAGLESLFRKHPGFRLVEGSTGEAAMAGPESGPEVLLVEAETLADPSAREAMEWAGAGGAAVLLVRDPASEPLAEALRAGVRAVLPSRLGGPELAAAIEAAAAGLVVIDGPDVETLWRVPSAVSADASERLIEALTPREMEVLRLLAAGLGNKEIAARLEISEHTVKFHVASIMGKLAPPAAPRR